jgi:hypothetical protein
MNYRIKIKLPKNKVNQFANAVFTPINISTLSNDEILNILNSYSSHIAIANLVKENILHIGDNKYIWDPNSQQLEFIKNYYTNPNIQFADQNTSPGENNTLNETSGREMYFLFFYKKKASLIKINEEYATLGLPALNCLRHIGKNYYIPDDINELYVTKKINAYLPNPSYELFEQIVRDFIKNKWVKTPITTETFDKEKLYSTYLYNGQYYQVPRVGYDNKDPKYIEIFYRVADEITPRLELQDFSVTTIIPFKDILLDATKQSYNSYRQNLPECYNLKSNQLARYFANEEDGINYYVPNYDKLPEEIRIELQKYVETNNSIANLVLKNIESEQQDLLGIQGDFETEFVCSRDPRFVEFLDSLNTRKDKKTNIFNYLFNALKYRGVKEENGIRSFNLSTDHFNTNKLNMPEFELYYRKGDRTTRGWYVKSNALQNNTFELSNFKLNIANFSPQNYRYDAVLQKNNKIYCILEFDGGYHFRPRSLEDNFIQRLTGDQIKSAFVDYVKTLPNETPIQIIRIPEYGKAKTKRELWKYDFKKFVISILNKYLGNQQESENVNPGLLEQTTQSFNPAIKAAYKIIKLIKK